MNPLCDTGKVRHFGFETPGKGAPAADAELGCCCHDERQRGGGGGGRGEHLWVGGMSFGRGRW